ncbi:hypothetical protein HELRODRAFT_181079 [Helobdella robusta]|uniref:Uncharacterized protein n=1 Tax=Helobdella robusta TaxID=6412 RepID=T1FGL3_HELRO|nr:hypothetical protein HELRODRAFT_181079 [Helobdella robusta]ESN93333.1 hypothetical protein HELRODRAFT_181079 [Helobdella robusta]
MRTRQRIINFYDRQGSLGIRTQTRPLLLTQKVYYNTLVKRKKKFESLKEYVSCLTFNIYLNVYPYFLKVLILFSSHQPPNQINTKANKKKFKGGYENHKIVRNNNNDNGDKTYTIINNDYLGMSAHASVAVAAASAAKNYQTNTSNILPGDTLTTKSTTSSFDFRTFFSDCNQSDVYSVIVMYLLDSRESISDLKIIFLVGGQESCESLCEKLRSKREYKMLHDVPTRILLEGLYGASKEKNFISAKMSNIVYKFENKEVSMPQVETRKQVVECLFDNPLHIQLSVQLELPRNQLNDTLFYSTVEIWHNNLNVNQMPLQIFLQEKCHVND